MLADSLKYKADYYFTVFTPTFNRAHLLHRVFNSLCSQSFTDFEWLIIDDGSTDHTVELVKGWQDKNLFPIRYYYQENQGKHIAWNRAADMAHGDYFLWADSDDEFVPESLELFRNSLENIPSHDRDKFYGVVALCKFSDGSIVGGAYPPNKSVSDFIELDLRGSEEWCCGRTKIHREIRFEEDIKGSYLPESTIWLKIGKKYKIALLNRPLRIYHQEADSICHTWSPSRNAPGMRAKSRLILNDFIEYYWKTSVALVLRNAKVYSRSCFHLDIPIQKQFADLGNRLARLFWAITLPYGFALYRYDKYRQSKKHQDLNR